MNHLTFKQEQLEVLERALTTWEEQEIESVSPNYQLLNAVHEARFRCIDVPVRYRADQPWKEDTESVETMVYAMGEELDRDVYPRNIGYGWPDVVEVSTEYSSKEDTLEALHDDVAMVVSVAHGLGWTLHDYDEERIIVKPAHGPEDVNKL